MRRFKGSDCFKALAAIDGQTTAISVWSWGSPANRALVGMFFLLVAGSLHIAFAQSSDLDECANRLDVALTQAHIHKLAAADFVDDEGKVTLQGVFLVDRLLALLNSQNAFQMLDRGGSRQSVYGKQALTGGAFENAAMGAARREGAEGLLAGKIKEDGDRLNVSIRVFNVSTGEIVEHYTISIPRTALLDDLATLSIRPEGPIHLVGLDGVSTPGCFDCPPPQYTEAARKDKLQGQVLLDAIVETSGRAVKIWEVGGLGDGLTERAIETVQQWRFRPAQDAKGKPVAVMVPIQVAFREF
jgi:TonB family protein